MIRKVAALVSALVLAAFVSACAASHALTGPVHHTCTPPAGGRCAADVAWPDVIMVTRDGRVLHGVINCGGTLGVVEQTSARVTVRLHVGAMPAGSMSCAQVDVSTRLQAPLGQRPVYDAVSGRRLRVEVADRCKGLALRCHA